MITHSLQELRIVLSTDDVAERDRVYAMLMKRAHQPGEALPAAPSPDARLADVEAIEPLAAFEPIFLISMGITVLASGSALGLWCAAHGGRLLGRIPTASPEGRALLEAIEKLPEVPRPDPPKPDNAPV
jgi:hypothetical protein